MEQNNKLKKAILISYGVIIFNIIAGLLYTPWMISKIGKSDFGLYVLVTTFLAYFVVDYGMWQSINILISKYRSEGNQKKIEETIGVASKIYLFFDLILCIVLFLTYFFIDYIFSNLSTEDLTKFKDIFLLAAFFSVLNFPFNFLKGLMFAYEFIVQNRYFELGTKICLIISTITVLTFGGGLYWLVIVYAITPFLKNILIVYFLYKQGVRMDIKFWSKDSAKSILGVSLWLFVYVISELFINNISPTIIAIRNSLTQVSLFAIGLTLYGYVYQISNSVSGFFLPKISRMQHEKQQNEIDIYALKIRRFQLLVVGFVTFGVFVSGSQFIEAWVGKEFEDSFYVAAIMIIPGLIIYSQQIEQSKLYVQNKVSLHSLMMLLTALFSVLISLLLTPLYGAIGAAVAISISSLFFMGFGMSIIYYKVVNFDMRGFYLMLGKFIAVFSLVTLLVTLLDMFIYNLFITSSNKWFKFLSCGITYTFFFIISVYFLLLNKYEKEFVIKILSTTLKKLKNDN